MCGSIRVDLAYLRRHTTYTSGLSDTDAHIIFFWDILAEFSDDELRKFVKFACNQERIPSGVSETAPSEDRTLVHEPPYPMKIAPPDEGRRAGAVDKRLVRAETCLFMIKLPQYSSKVRYMCLCVCLCLFDRLYVGNYEEAAAVCHQCSRRPFEWMRLRFLLS